MTDESGVRIPDGDARPSVDPLIALQRLRRRYDDTVLLCRRIWTKNDALESENDALVKAVNIYAERNSALIAERDELADEMLLARPIIEAFIGVGVGGLIDAKTFADACVLAARWLEQDDATLAALDQDDEGSLTVE